MLHVGRLSPEKNLALLAEAWDQVSTQDTSGRKLHLVIVGDGPARAELQRRLPHAVFTGALTGEPLAAAYASASAKTTVQGTRMRFTSSPAACISWGQ